jgi:hypothetical protein
MRATISVTGVRSQKRLDVITYLPQSSSWESPTNSEYANHILTGLGEWGAPSDYVAYVRDIIERALEANGDVNQPESAADTR